MAIINTNLGGTDASDGDVLYAADLNDTFDATLLHHDNEAYATEVTHTGDTNYYTDANLSFTGLAADNALLLGIHVTFDAKQSTAGSGYVRVRVVDSTGTKYLRPAVMNDSSTFYAVILSSADYPLLTHSSTGSYVTAGGSAFAPYILNGTVSVYIDIKTTDGSGTVAIQNVSVDIAYAKVGVSDA